MRSTPKAFVVYVVLLALVPVAWLAAMAYGLGFPALDLSTWIMVAIFVGLIAIAGRFPLHISKKTKVIVDTGLIFAALLLFPFPWGPLVACAGSLLGLLVDRSPLLDIVVNTGATLWQGLAAQWVYLLLGGSVPPVFDRAQIALPLLAAAATLLLVDRLAISLAVALHQRANPIRLFANSWGWGVVEELALYLLGVLTAVVTESQPWALILAVMPIALVYVSLRNGLRLQLLTREAVEAMADVIDRRDPYTAGHSARVALLAERIAARLNLSWDEIETIRAAARVHDLGKIEIDGAVLTKPGALSSDEWQLIRRHPVSGCEIVSGFPEFARGASYVHYHHERWDGRGYPDQLRGSEIPLGASIIAVADTYDAMTSDRPYRRALSSDVVLEQLRQGSGAQWDPRVVEALLSLLREDHLGGAGAKELPVAHVV